MFWIFSLPITFLVLIDGKPTLDNEKFGPCANAENPMDCLHGILMHGDSDQGDTHKHEDTYLRFKPQLEAGKPKTQAGPKDADETFHAALMHGDGEVHHSDGSEMLPKKPAEKFGPDDADKMLHGVLMHGDGELGHDHGKEDEKAKNKETKVEGKAEPLDAEGMMHGILMHGDSKAEPHDHHDESSTENHSGTKGPSDINEMMHKFMHKDGDTEHHEAADDKPKGKSAPTDQENFLHSLMHGDEGTQHKDDDKDKPFKFDIDEIMKLGLPEDVLKKIGLDKLKKKDEKDYKEWQKEQKDDNSESWGSTFAYITDTILNDIEIMKRRYLAQDDKVQKEINDYANSKNADFTDKDANENLELEGQDHDGNDVTHDLELIGSTEPINARHKAHMESERKKKKA